MPPFDPIMDRFLELLEPDARQTFLKLDSPEAVQAFLDELPYSAEDANRCPKPFCARCRLSAWTT